MDSPESDDTYVLIVTGPARDRLYERFSKLFWGRSGVEVVKDRRLDQRRHADDGSRSSERRNRERRRRRPEWIVPPV